MILQHFDLGILVKNTIRDNGNMEACKINIQQPIMQNYDKLPIFLRKLKTLSGLSFVHIQT